MSVRLSRSAILGCAMFAAIGLTAPASAEQPQQQSANNSAPRAEAQRDRQICIREQQTGSHLIRRVCRTRAEWIARGETDLVR